MSEQLALPTSRKAAKADACRCGHFSADHARGRGICEVCGVGCHRFRPRVRVELPPGLAAPAGALELVRPDTKRTKAMGWALVGAHEVRIFLNGLKTISLNTERNMLMSAARGGQSRVMKIGIAISTMHKKQRECALAAIEQANVLRREHHVPDEIEVTRLVSGPGLDGHDNLRGALKRVIDGLAEGLLLNDAVFSSGRPALTYSQRSPGRRGVVGVEIRLTWRAP